MGLALAECYLHEGEVDMAEGRFEEALRLQTLGLDSLSAASSSDPLFAVYLQNVRGELLALEGRIRINRWPHSGETEDLTRGIEALKTGIPLAPKEHPMAQRYNSISHFYLALGLTNEADLPENRELKTSKLAEAEEWANLAGIGESGKRQNPENPFIRTDLCERNYFDNERRMGRRSLRI